MHVTRRREAPHPEATARLGNSNHIQPSFPATSFPHHQRGGFDETILFSRRADRAQFFGLCRPFDFIQRRQPSGAHRILQALPFGLVRLDVDLQKASTGATSATAMTTIAT